MRNEMMPFFKKLRFVLVLTIVFANTLVFAALTPKAEETCYSCTLKQGGASGYYADCSDPGNKLSLCLYTSMTHCYGYRCGGFGEEEEFEAEGGGPYLQH